MTINQRVREQAFSYDPALPPSIPAGQPLRAARVPTQGTKPTRRPHPRGIFSLAGRLRTSA